MQKGGGFTHKYGGYLQYTAEDIRFTRKGNTIYAIVLGRPEKNQEILIKSFGEDTIQGDLKVTNVTMLGHKGEVDFEKSSKGLIVTGHKNVDELAVVFKIETTGQAQLR